MFINTHSLSVKSISAHFVNELKIFNQINCNRIKVDEFAE